MSAPLTGAVATARALIVDDVAFNRRFLSVALARDGLQADEAADARSALDALARTSYDVVLLDIALGEGDSGLDVLRAMRLRPELDAVPVILVTGYARDTESVAGGLLAGAHDYVTRPFDPSILRARVSAARRARAMLLETRRMADRATMAASMPRDEINAAAEVQRGWLPRCPVRSGPVVVCGEVVASREVSGDLFDVITDARERVTVALIDVAGHGAAAALVASAARGAIRRTLGAGEPLDIVMRDLSACLSAHAGAMASAAAVGLVRFAKDGKSAEVLNAGLPAIAQTRGGGGVRQHPSRSAPVGLFDGTDHRFDVVPVLADDVFVLTSDGMCAGSHDSDDVLALVERLRPALNLSSIAATSRASLGRWIREMTSSTFASEASDDATLVLAACDTALSTGALR